MTDRSDLTALAHARHQQGYNCAQSALSVFAEDLGLPLDVALRLAAPFGGGIGRQGEICGAASGALLALGLRYGSAAPDRAAKERAYAVAAEFMRRFASRNGASNGAVRCRDLIQADQTTPEGLALARERQVFSTLCPNIIAAAVAIAAELLAEE